MPNPEIVCLALSTRDSASASSGTNDNTPICMASVMEALLVSSIWEIQDSVMDFLVALMKTVEGEVPITFYAGCTRKFSIFLFIKHLVFG